MEKKLKIDTPEKDKVVVDILRKMTDTIDKQEILKNKLNEGELTESEIDEYVNIDQQLNEIHQYLKRVIDKYGE